MISLKVNKQSTLLAINVEGSIDEDASLPSLDFSGISHICFDFKELKLINSCGIRDWVNWLKAFPTSLKIEYTQCPPILIDQINMISGLLPQGGIVSSFYVPYFSEKEDDVVLQLFNKGQEVPEEISLPSGETVELDVIPEKYFKFLKQAA